MNDNNMIEDDWDNLFSVDDAMDCMPSPCLHSASDFDAVFGVMEEDVQVVDTQDIDFNTVMVPPAFDLNSYQLPLFNPILFEPPMFGAAFSCVQNASVTPVESRTPALTIEEGLNYEPDEKERQRGGKDNTQPLPKHVIAIDRAMLNAEYQNCDLLLFCNLMGYEKKSNNKSILHQLKNIRIRKTETKIIFEDIVIQHATQFYGRKPFTLQFTIRTLDGIELACVETFPFRTITKRGEEKRSVKRTKNGKVILSSLQPSRCHVNGNQLIRIYVDNIPRVKLADVRVTFGSVHTRAYTLVPEEDMLICEIPAASVTTAATTVNVAVSFDKGNNWISTFNNADEFTYTI